MYRMKVEYITPYYNFMSVVKNNFNPLRKSILLPFYFSAYSFLLQGSLYLFFSKKQKYN